MLSSVELNVLIEIGLVQKLVEVYDLPTLQPACSVLPFYQYNG